MKSLRMAAAAVAFALLASCAPAPEPVVTPTATVSANAARDINPVDPTRLLDEGMVRFALTSLPKQWNPHHADGTGEDASLVRSPLSAPSFTLDAAGRATPDPDFITATTVDHGAVTTVTLVLNPRAVWGDGAPITAADWVATWQALTGQIDGVRAVDTEGWDRVAQVRAGASATEVVLTYRRVDADWAEPLVDGPLRAGAVGDAAAFDGWTTPDASLFAGPFVITHLDQLQGVITLERNPLWWGTTPRLDRIVFRTIQPEGTAAAFAHNELDYLGIGTSTDRLEQSRLATDAIIRSAPDTRGRELVLDTSGVLADPALRQALLLALDREAIAEATLADLDDTPTVWSDPLVLPNQPGYTDQGLATGLDHDQAVAAQALEDAGWKLTDGRRVRDAVALELSFSLEVDDTFARTELREISTQLAALGIPVIPVTSGGDLTPRTVTVDAFPLADVATRSDTTRSDAGGSDTGGSDTGGSDVDAATADQAARVASETDLVRRADQASQLGRLLWQQARQIPLYQLPQNVAVKAGLANFGAPAYSTTAWENVGWTR